MTFVVIARNAVTAKLVDAPPEIKELVSEYLSYSVSGAEFSSSFQSNHWDGRSTFFKHRSSSFPAGFVRGVMGKLKRSGHKVRLVLRDIPEPLGEVRPMVNEFGYTDEYSYQPETVDKLVEMGGMIAQLATGAGKSNVATIAIARIKRPTLFITTRGVLMYQMKAAIERSLEYRSTHGEPELMGSEVGVIGDGVWKPKKITVAMVQTLVARLKDPDPFSSKEAQARQAKIQDKAKLLLSKFELVILEEAHEAAGNGYYSILSHCSNAYYRLALTATPFMKDDVEANMRLMACVGPIGIKVTEKELIDKGILATPYFKYIDNPKSKKLFNTTSWQRAYKLGVAECVERNKLIITEARRGVAMGLSVLILVGHVSHGKLLAKALSTVTQAVFLYGKNEQDERSAELKRLEAGTLNILIGSTICDVGIDVPSIGMVILAGGGKAEVALRQRIGRGLRRKKKGIANVTFVVDFLDNHNSHLRSHAAQRRLIVENTDGFHQGILAKDKDFNWGLLKAK